MKEAAGEANMTVITIVLIAIVLGVGTIVITNLMDSTTLKSACMNQGYNWSGRSCKRPDGSTYPKGNLCQDIGGSMIKGSCKLPEN